MRLPMMQHFPATEPGFPPSSAAKFVTWCNNPCIHIRAVYTCIKKPESFVHSGFSWEVARQLPLNTVKNPNRKTHLRSRIFWNSAGFSGVFANVNACSNLAGYYSGFWSRGTWPSAESPDRGPRRNAHYTCTVKGSSREVAHAHHLPKHQYEIRGVFAHALFVPKNPNVMGFSGCVNGTTKNPGFLDFGFCQCKWAYHHMTSCFVWDPYGYWVIKIVIYRPKCCT